MPADLQAGRIGPNPVGVMNNRRRQPKHPLLNLTQRVGRIAADASWGCGAVMITSHTQARIAELSESSHHSSTVGEYRQMSA